MPPERLHFKLPKNRRGHRLNETDMPGRWSPLNFRSMHLRRESGHWSKPQNRYLYGVSVLISW